MRDRVEKKSEPAPARKTGSGQAVRLPLAGADQITLALRDTILHGGLTQFALMLHNTLFYGPPPDQLCEN